MTMTPEEKKRRAKNAHLLKRFGITLQEYEDLLAFQNGVCFICSAVPNVRALAVDHDHKTGAIRGLLCLYCNKYRVGNLTKDTIIPIHEYLFFPPANEFFGIPRHVPIGMENPPKRRRKKRAISRRRIS